MLQIYQKSWWIENWVSTMVHQRKYGIWRTNNKEQFEGWNIYLDIFLSCWLCLFVFPLKGSFLRLGLVKIASSLANGTIYSLVIPVLANIYHGLGLTTKASNPIGWMDFHFPMHYVHVWFPLFWHTLPSSSRSTRSQDDQLFRQRWVYLFWRIWGTRTNPQRCKNSVRHKASEPMHD